MLSACDSDKPDTDVRTEVSFATSGGSRASETLAFDRFAVYGDMKFPVDNSTAPLVVFDNKEVVYAGGSWTYGSDLRYWFPKHEHSFVAVSPVSVTGTGSEAVYSNSKLSFSYTMPASDGNLLREEVSDIFSATHRRLYSSGDNGLLTLKFRHLMSMVDIAPALDDNTLGSDGYILLHEMEFSGVATKARFDIVPAERQSNSQTDDMVLDVIPQEEGNLSVKFNTPVKIENNKTNVRPFANGDAVIMLPNDFTMAADAKLTLYYTINDETSMLNGSISLNNLKWESGKSYLYKFTIERAGVNLTDCEINPWNEVKGENIIVD